MTLYLSKYLTKENIDNIKKNFGFTNPQIIEKFIMDFEMQYQISQKLECITRGGLCVPFHISDHKARRLSEDIDLVTQLSPRETTSIIKQLQDNMSDIRIQQHIPKNPKPIPLVTYRAFYTSCYGGENSIKIDILCDTNTRSQEIKTIPAGFQVFAFDTPGTISILDHGSLIGDKLSTLALSTPIGMNRQDDENGIMKQIYDVSTLLKLATKDKIVQSFETFSSYTDLKIQRYNCGLSLNNIISSIGSSLEEFIQMDKQLSLEKEHTRRFTGFTGNYLGSIPYRPQSHISDILLIRLFNKSMSHIQNGSTSSNDAADKFFNQVQQVNQINLIEEGTEIAKIKQELLGSFPESYSTKPLKAASPAQIFLIKELLN